MNLIAPVLVCHNKQTKIKLFCTINNSKTDYVYQLKPTFLDCTCQILQTGKKKSKILYLPKQNLVKRHSST